MCAGKGYVEPLGAGKRACIACYGVGTIKSLAK